MRSCNPADWASFFTALTGLLFVAVSINLDRIIKGGRFLPAGPPRRWPSCCWC